MFSPFKIECRGRYLAGGGAGRGIVGGQKFRGIESKKKWGT
jgi:hypothetical protein